MRVQRTSVARVAAQQAGYFENIVAGCGFLDYFYNVMRLHKCI